ANDCADKTDHLCYFERHDAESLTSIAGCGKNLITLEKKLTPRQSQACGAPVSPQHTSLLICLDFTRKTQNGLSKDYVRSRWNAGANVPHNCSASSDK